MEMTSINCFIFLFRGRLQSLIANEDFQHILRVLNTNVDGRQKIMFALTSIKGVGRRFANLVCKKADVDMSKRQVSSGSHKVMTALIVMSSSNCCGDFSAILQMCPISDHYGNILLTFGLPGIMQQTLQGILVLPRQGRYLLRGCVYVMFCICTSSQQQRGRSCQQSSVITAQILPSSCCPRILQPEFTDLYTQHKFPLLNYKLQS